MHCFLVGVAEVGPAQLGAGVCLTSLMGDLFELVEMGFGLPRLAGMWPLV